MKRLLFVVLLAVAFAGVMAAPALGASPSAASFRLPERTAYIIAYGDGWWFEVTDVDSGAFALHAAGKAIPGNYDVAMQLSWKTVNLGLCQTLPSAFFLTLSVPEAGVDLSRTAAAAYWSGPFLWDDYWVNALGPIPAFNPSIGAQVYANRWLPSLTGKDGVAKNLTADYKLPQGTYTVVYSEFWSRTYTGLDLGYDDEGNPLTTPWHVSPTTDGSGVNVLTFKVGPPKK